MYPHMDIIQGKTAVAACLECFFKLSAGTVVQPICLHGIRIQIRIQDRLIPNA